MMRDATYFVAWVFIIAAIFVFSIVMRDLLLMRAEYIEREKQREKLMAADDE